MTLDEMKTKAQLIQNQLNTIIGQIDPEDIDGAINWGDLSCIEVGISLTDNPPIWTALVSEAGPGATDLAVYLHNELTRFGHDVYVRCEW